MPMLMISHEAYLVLLGQSIDGFKESPQDEEGRHRVYFDDSTLRALGAKALPKETPSDTIIRISAGNPN